MSADDQAIRSLLVDLADRGAAVDIAVLKSEGHAYEHHRDAAFAGMRLFAARSDCYFEHLAAPNRTPRAGYFQLSMDAALAEGEKITVAEFLGDGFDPTSRTMHSAANDLANVAKKGFAYALCSPSHGHVSDSAMLISTAMDAGKEWWGTFYWTVALPGMMRMVVVGASSTD